VFLAVKLHVSLRFEQQRFYNPHHHPEMPRTLQSLDGRVGNGEDYNPMLYDQVYVSSKVQVTPEASLRHLKEKIY
jgi:hypothetical protein